MTKKNGIFIRVFIVGISDHKDGIGQCIECDMEGAFGMNSNCTHFNADTNCKEPVPIPIKDIKRFKMSDLVGRRIILESFKSSNKELFVARDLNTGDLFVIEEM